MRGIRLFCLLLTIIWQLAACSTTPAPVIDRLPAGKVKQLQTTASKAGNDWRPQTYMVKKGDTLYSIGLEYGYDYKEIAAANQISPPYLIRIGQILKFSTLNEPAIAAENGPQKPFGDESGVTTYPIQQDSAIAAITTNVKPAEPAHISEPKAIREPYSDKAYNTPLPASKATKPDTIANSAKNGAAENTKKPVAEKPALEPKAETKTEVKADNQNSTATNANLNWIWPAKGRVIAKFNDAGNKGIDIAGKMGQEIQSTAAGKVIYSGSDLRGYGKLVIVKHNATYLSVYANNSKILVKEGQQVKQGQKIAEMGDSDSNSVKLHFEIRQQGKSVDPMKFLSENGN
ncbi:MAG: peptidase M23 [Betaproteobacteria bacterium HGW-Betaproteobacteria-22]|nr:MAG: peptidase M23 [Betaproteobacteria bacterium HGW-Betaproteobacteria-22]